MAAQTAQTTSKTPASSLSSIELGAMARGDYWPRGLQIDWSPLTRRTMPPCMLCGDYTAEDCCRQHIARQYLRRRQQALAEMESYRQFIEPSGHLDFVYPPARHHRVIQEHLDALLNDDIRRLMIFCPPGAAKSTYSSIQAVTKFMAKNPNKNVLCCSNTQDLAEAFNRRRRMVIETSEWQELSGTSLDPKNQGVKEFGLLAGGLSIAAGAGTSITGKRSHFNVADDLIIGHEQAASVTQLDKMWQWWMSDFRSRLVPRSPELVIMTRWSAGDIAGRLLDSPEADSWTILRLPMECDDPGNDPMHRELGEPLWPEWYEDERVDEFKRNPRDWVSLFQQRPVDEKGTWAPEEHLHRVPRETIPKDLNVVVAADIALTIGGGDFTVFGAIGICPEKKLYLIDVYRQQVGTDQSADDFLDFCQKHRPSRALVDDDNASKVWTKYVFERARARGYAPPLQMRPTRGQNKEVRAAAFRGYVLSDQFHVVDSQPWTADVIAELLNFPSAAANDDIVDVLSLVGREMQGNSAPVARTPVKPLDLGKPIIEKDGVRYLNTTLDVLHDNRASDILSVSQIYRRGY